MIGTFVGALAGGLAGAKLSMKLLKKLDTRMEETKLKREQIKRDIEASQRKSNIEEETKDDPNFRPNQENSATT